MKNRATLIATFANGDTVTRTSGRPFTHGWRVTAHTGKIVDEGFASTRNLAEIASTTVFRRLPITGGTVEVVELALAPDGYLERVKAERPYTVRRTYPAKPELHMPERKYLETGRGGNALRFADLAGAEAYARRCESAERHGATYSVLKNGEVV